MVVFRTPTPLYRLDWCCRQEIEEAMSHYGYVVEQLTHESDSEREHRKRRRQVPRNRGGRRWPSFRGRGLTNL